MEGTLTLSHSRVKVLFDTRVLNSFIVFKLVQDLGLVSQTLKVSLNTVSPLGATIKLGRVCKDCPITLYDRNFPTNLIVLSMKEFDVILGIDWLTKFYSNLDCVSESITFLVPGSLLINFQCYPSSNGFFTSRLIAIEIASSDITVIRIPLVREFEDVFRGITSLPLKREINFCI